VTAGTYANTEGLVYSGAGAVTLQGTAGANLLVGNGAANSLSGLAGNDTLDGGAGADTMNGGADNDTYFLDSSDVLSDSGGTDTVITAVSGLTLGAGQLAGIENLTLIGAAASGTGSSVANVMVGNAVANTLSGAGGIDELHGGAGNDSLLGGDGADEIYGDDGDDVIFGGEGVDFIIGGAGSDTMTGGTLVTGDNDAGLGNNFVFDTSPLSGDIDTITDFCAGRDDIWLDPAFFAVFANPASSTSPVANPTTFLSGATLAAIQPLQNEQTRLLFEVSTGTLYYDQDGNGAGSAVAFAIFDFQAGNNLVIADFKNLNLAPI
jgi:Ca2+-binding RTX toxin-like protein